MLIIDAVTTSCVDCVVFRGRSIVAAACVTAMVITALGCHDPNRKTKQAIRDGRLEEMFEVFEAREEERPQQLQAMAALDRELRAEHAKRLNKTLRMIEKAYLKDKKGWMKYDGVRYERVRSVWGGDPQEIPETVRKRGY